MVTSGINSSDKPNYNQKQDLKTNTNLSKSNTFTSNVITKQIKAFVEKTSCHGVQRITTYGKNHDDNGEEHGVPSKPTTYGVKSYVWFLLTLSSFGMASFNLFETIEDYCSYRTNTLIERKAQTVIVFPALAVCNVNFAPLDVLLKYPQFEPLLQKTGYDNPSRHFGVSALGRQTGHETRIKSAFGFLSEEEKVLSGHLMEEMLLDCRFGGEKCDASDFRIMYSYRYGICYTFNFAPMYRKRAQEVRTLRKIEDGLGLVVTLDIQSDRYLPFTEKVGVRVVIHNPWFTPDLELKGITAAPGLYTTVGLSMTETIEAEPPYGRCVSSDSDQSHRIMDPVPRGKGYTKALCERSCLQAHFIQGCGCCDSNIPCNPKAMNEMFGIPLTKEQGSGNDPHPPPPTCNISVSLQSRCVASIRTKIKNEATCEQQCPPQCKTLSYESESSVTAWPSQLFVSGIYKDINGSSRSGIFENESTPDQKLAFVRENVLKLDVNFVTDTKLKVITQPAYTWSLLLSNIGGQLGLWLGFSILTAFEILELLWDMVVEGICHTVKGSRA